MAARDDSVIRGSLITCIILLVLSLALNFLLWSSGNAAKQGEANLKTAMSDKDNSIRTMSDKIDTYEKMLGVGTLTTGDIETMKDANSGDATFDQIQKDFHKHMKLFGPDEQTPNYARMPEYFTNTIRDRNVQYGTARDEAAQIRVQAASDIETARVAQQKAEEERENLAKELDDERADFATYRDDMLNKMEQARDSKTKSERLMQEIQRKAGTEVNSLTQRAKTLENTIENQKLELNRLRGGRFENVQGEIRYVLRGADIVAINLGSADSLRRGITFGVIDKDDTHRLQDAKIKASIQVIKIRGPHLAECRVVAKPDISSPIIVGDAVYSPFWAPGRKVRIALAGTIDIDGDNRPDNDLLEGMILSTGAEIAARVGTDGRIDGKLDAGVRFLVVGEPPDLGGRDEEQAAAEIAAVGRARELARELGITVIPAWKLQSYLATLDDGLTTPLGSAVRGDDFPPEAYPGPDRRRPEDLPEIYKTQQENMQRNNEILRP